MGVADGLEQADRLIKVGFFVGPTQLPLKRLPFVANHSVISKDDSYGAVYVIVPLKWSVMAPSQCAVWIVVNVHDVSGG